MTARVRVWVVVTSLLCGAAASAEAGPYSVGFVQAREFRTSLVGTQRPLEIAIFYPVDPAQVSANPLILSASGYLTDAQAQAQLEATGCFRTDLLSPRVAHEVAVRYLLAFLETDVAVRTSRQAILTPGHALTHESHAHFFVTEPNGGFTVAEGWDSYFTFFPYQPGAATERAHADGIAGRPVPVETED